MAANAPDQVRRLVILSAPYAQDGFFPEMLPHWRVNQAIRLRGEKLEITQAPASPVEVAAQ
jgi:hypothetical protein